MPVTLDSTEYTDQTSDSLTFSDQTSTTLSFTKQTSTSLDFDEYSKVDGTYFGLENYDELFYAARPFVIGRVE